MDKRSLSRTSWERVYHIVWIPKHGRKVPCGETRKEIGEILRMLVGHMDGVEMVEGTACVDHTRICLRIAPKHSAGNVVGRLGGRARSCRACGIPSGAGRPAGTARRGRGGTTSANGLNEAVIRKYIQNQEDGSKTG